MTTAARKRVKQMTVAQRLAAHRARTAKQERAAVALLRIVSTATEPAELDSLDNMVALAVAAKSITPGRAAGIRDVLRGVRKRLARKAVATCPE